MKDTALAPAIETELGHVLASLGGSELLNEADPAERRPLLAEIRMTLFQGAKLLASPAGIGWSHTETDILQSTGEQSVAGGGGSVRRAAVADKALHRRARALALACTGE
ncbi:MAG: hypothetical protein OEW21_12145 [Betaproteobacteria bacterium]|nr:hypothetical protein [Betaproteobacteria bacterium]